MSPAPRALCVQCRKAPVVPEWRPFCSQRCRLLDLAQWVDGGYRVAGATVPDDPDADEPTSTEPDRDRPSRG